MTGKRVRLLQASAVLGAAGAGIALTAGPAAAGSASVAANPTQKLHDGQQISVFWDTGQPWSTQSQYVQYFAVECPKPLVAGTVFSTDVVMSCSLLGSQLSKVQAPDGDLEIEGTVTVSKSLSPQPGTCMNQCSIAILAGASGIPQTVLSSGGVPITFK